MRLFLAIQLSPAVREALLTAQDALRRQGRGSFPPPENLHLTLAFLGEAEDPARARAALSEVSCRPFSLAVGGPPGHFGDLWWAGVRADPALEELAVSLQADLRSRGFCQEDRPWLPHITLVRRWRGEVPQVTVPHAWWSGRSPSCGQTRLTANGSTQNSPTNPCVKKQPAPLGAGCFCSGKGV